MIQVNNSFSGQNYLPLSLGFLVSYAEFHCKNFDDFEFLNPIYKRTRIKDVVKQYKDCDIVAFSVYVWNNNISMRIAKALKKINPNILTIAGGCHIPERPEYIEKYNYTKVELYDQDTINMYKEISVINIDFSKQKIFLQEQFKSLKELAKQTDTSFIGAVNAQEKKKA